MRWPLALIAAALAGLLTLYATMNDDLLPDSEVIALPADPAGRRAAVRQAIATRYRGDAVDILLGQGILETGNFTSRAFPASLSIWNRHVGSGKNGDWNGRVYMDGVIYANDAAALAVDPTNAREHLRCFDSLEQCARDMAGLLSLSLYAPAALALSHGDASAYAVAIARGDGKNGFVGPVSTTKAANYTAGLLREFNALGVA